MLLETTSAKLLQLLRKPQKRRTNLLRNSVVCVRHFIASTLAALDTSKLQFTWVCTWRKVYTQQASDTYAKASRSWKQIMSPWLI